MRQPPEGSRVSYIGRPENGPEMGAQGRLLAVTGSSGHVKWEGGVLHGQLTLTHLDDIVVTSAAPKPGSFTSGDGLAEITKDDDTDDSLEFGHTASRDEDEDLLADYWNEG